MAEAEHVDRGAVKLGNAELLFQAIESISDYAIFLLNPSGHIITWNKGAERIKGYQQDEILGRHFSIFYTSEDIRRGHPDDELKQARAKGFYAEEGWRVRKDGTRFWASVVITRHTSQGGTELGFLKVTKDLTEKKIAEESLRQSEERFRLLVDGLKDYAVFMLDANGYVTTWNAGARRIKGYEASEVLGKHVSIFYPGESSEEAAQDALAIAAREGYFQEEALRKRKDGSTFWAHVSITAVYDKEGRCVSFAKVTRDISELREAQLRLQKMNEDLEKRVQERTLQLLKNEEELKNAKEAAEAANKAKSAFLANMSHEIRTPLGAVLGFSELLTEPDVSEKDRKHYIETVKRNGELLSNIVRDILDLSKVEVGKVETEIQTIPLNEILIDLTTLLNLQASEKGIQLQISQEGTLPPVIRTDPLRLRQILINIVGNAIKFTDKGQVRVHLRMTKNSEGSGLLEFLVSDTGKGIEAHHIAALFQPFSQVDVSSRRKYGGTGLGLVLSRRLANLLGGDVTLAETKPGKGSTFSITIGLASHSDSTPLQGGNGSSDSSSNSSSPYRKLSNVRILVVEDAPDNQLLVTRILKIAGAVTELAENGLIGLQKARENTYDLILMDLQMPVMDGYQATAQLRAEGYARPILALTAHALKEERQRCLSSGFDDHLSKPIDRTLLLETIARFVGR